MRAARLRAIKSDVVENLPTGELTVTTIAARHSRYIHKLFGGEGITYSEFVRDQHAHWMMTDPRLTHRTINSLACDVGFGDQSYFNRTFRRRNHATPSQVRKSPPRWSVAQSLLRLLTAVSGTEPTGIGVAAIASASACPTDAFNLLRVHQRAHQMTERAGSKSLSPELLVISAALAPIAIAQQAINISKTSAVSLAVISTRFSKGRNQAS